MNNNDQINSHESFGAIRISRGQGSPAVLFGSSIKSHSFIQIEISNCEEIELRRKKASKHKLVSPY